MEYWFSPHSFTWIVCVYFKRATLSMLCWIIILYLNLSFIGRAPSGTVTLWTAELSALDCRATCWILHLFSLFYLFICRSLQQGNGWHWRRRRTSILPEPPGNSCCQMTWGIFVCLFVCFFIFSLPVITHAESGRLWRGPRDKLTQKQMVIISMSFFPPL